MNKHISFEKEKENEKEVPEKEIPRIINVEKPTTKSRDVDVIQPHNIDELTTNSDAANKNMEKPTTSSFSPTPPIQDQGT